MGQSFREEYMPKYHQILHHPCQSTKVNPHLLGLTPLLLLHEAFAAAQIHNDLSFLGDPSMLLGPK